MVSNLPPLTKLSALTWAEKLSELSKHSDDPDTKTACILEFGGLVVAEAANGLPRNTKATVVRTTRPDKYAWIMHAERKAISLAARRGLCTAGTTAHLNWFPCAQCAGALVESGILVLDADRQAYESRKDDPRYEFAVAMEMLLEARVVIGWH